MKKNSDNFTNAQIGNNSNIHVGDNLFLNNEMKIIFNEKKFKDILDLLNEEFAGKETNEILIEPQAIKRNQTEKNKRHNITDAEYEDLIVRQVRIYERDMENFFKNPRNNKIKRTYNQLLNSFNLILKAYDKKFDNIFCFFMEINAKMKERFQNEIEEYEDDLISLFLCYSYYLCDLDKK